MSFVLSPQYLLLDGVAPADRRRTVAACVPKLLGVKDVVLAHTPYGQPIIRRPEAACMSVSYRNGLLALAVNARGGIGVDLEILRDDLDVLEIARTCFGPEETHVLTAAQGRRRIEKFFALWTAKEAVLKYRGQGITNGMAWPRLPSLELGSRALVDGIEVFVSWRRFAGREIVTAVATQMERKQEALF